MAMRTHAPSARADVPLRADPISALESQRWRVAYISASRMASSARRACLCMRKPLFRLSRRGRGRRPSGAVGTGAIERDVSPGPAGMTRVWI